MRMTISEELWAARAREQRNKTLRLLGWLAFWIVLFIALHALT